MIDTSKLVGGLMYLCLTKQRVYYYAEWLEEDQKFDPPLCKFYLLANEVTEVRGPIIFEQLPLVTTAKDTDQ